MNNENSKESGFNWTGGSWPAYCTTILNGRVVGKVWRGDDGLLHAMVLKGMSKGFETIGYYIDIYSAQDAVERWVTDNRKGLVPNARKATQGQEEHAKPKRWKMWKHGDTGLGFWSLWLDDQPVQTMQSPLDDNGAQRIEDVFNEVIP